MLFVWSTLLIITIIILYYHFTKQPNSIKTYKKCINGEGTPYGLFNDILIQNNIKPSEHFDLYIPCNYTHCEKEIISLFQKQNYKNKFFFMIDGCDYLAGKDALWSITEQKYGREISSTILPNTYLLPKQLSSFIFDKNKRYILKKNIQRKEGIKITNNFQEINNAHKEDFKIVQEYIDNIYCFKNHKINFRLYILIISRYGKTKYYLYNNGKCIYANKPLKPNSNETEEQITSIHLDTNIYNKFPLTTKEFGAINQNWEKTFKHIQNNLSKLLKAFKHYITQNENLKKNISFQLFGTDIILNDQMYPYILEFNKGPSLIPVNQKDKMLKSNLLKDMLDLVCYNKINNYIEL